MNKLLKTTALLGLLAGSLAFSGCIFAVGGSGPNPAPAKGGTTLGQELVDLQKARDSGAITEAEYEAQRSKLLGASKSK